MRSPERGSRHGSIWVGAVVVGLAAVLYAKLIAAAQALFLRQVRGDAGTGFPCCARCFFVLATYLVRRFAPEAKGSGIPQVLEAIELGKPPNERQHEVPSDTARNPPRDPWQSSLVSIWTAIIQGYLVARRDSRVAPRSGAKARPCRSRPRPSRRSGAGCAAILRADRLHLVTSPPARPPASRRRSIPRSPGSPSRSRRSPRACFGPFRQTMMLAVIISGITAQALIGDYLYFGHPSMETPDLRSRDLRNGPDRADRGLAGRRVREGARLSEDLPASEELAPALARLRLVCSAIGFFTHGKTAGSGYDATRAVLMGATGDKEASLFFPIFKLDNDHPLLSLRDGGRDLLPLPVDRRGSGNLIAKIFSSRNFRVCALIGMVAFFSAAVQAPLTGGDHRDGDDRRAHPDSSLHDGRVSRAAHRPLADAGTALSLPGRAARGSLS